MPRSVATKNGPREDLIDNAGSPNLDDWQNGKNLLEANQYMLHNEMVCDVTFVVGDGKDEVKAHRYVMVSRSPLLQDALADHMGRDNVMIRVEDVSLYTFKDVLTYMYTERIDIRSENVGALLYASKRFHLKGLLDACIEFLDSKISVEDVCKILEQAHTYNETKLFEKCLKFILLNAADVLKTRAFSEVCPDCLKKIISSNDLKADEEVIFEATMEWATNECRRKRMTATDENRRQVLGNLLYLIRFPTMDVTYFTHRVSMRDILSDDEAVSVFQYFHGEERELSRKFNRNERNRIKSKKSYMVDSNSNPGLGNFEPMTTAQFVESRRTMRISPTVRFASPVKQKTPLVLSIPKGPNISRVARFASYDGKWKQNGPPDAISFTCSSHIVLYGVEMYGACSGAETYKVKIYLYDDMKEEVCRNEVVVNTDSYRTTCDVMFPRKVRVPPRRVFTVVVAIKGSPCHKGIDGRAFRERDGVTFEFINSNRSSNGTDVNVGQIPALIFDRTE